MHLVQRRMILFFCRILASSANQISIAARSMSLSCAISARRQGNFFEMLERSPCLAVMARPGSELAIPQTVQLAAQRLSGDADPELLPHGHCQSSA
jgi:hypothetical protein